MRFYVVMAVFGWMSLGRMLQGVSGLFQSAILEVPPQAHMGTSDRYIKQLFSCMAMLSKYLESF